jgi:hypothetical protein
MLHDNILFPAVLKTMIHLQYATPAVIQIRFNTICCSLKSFVLSCGKTRICYNMLFPAVDQAMIHYNKMFQAMVQAGIHYNMLFLAIVLTSVHFKMLFLAVVRTTILTICCSLLLFRL